MSKGSSAKNLWSTTKEGSPHLPRFLDSRQQTQSKVSGSLSGSASRQENSRAPRLAQQLHRAGRRPSREGGFDSGAKSQSKGKLFSMRKQAKRRGAPGKSGRAPEPKLVLGSGLKAELVQASTRLLIGRAKLSREDFDLPGQKLASLFERRRQESSKRALLEQKLALQSRLERKEDSRLRGARQNSIFEETQAKFERNPSSTRAALLLQKIVAKDKSPLSRGGALPRRAEGAPGQRSERKLRVKRTRTRDFGRGAEGDSRSRFAGLSRKGSRNESLSLSESLGVGPCGPQSKKTGRFFYKKTLKTNFDREVR